MQGPSFFLQLVESILGPNAQADESDGDVTMELPRI